MTLGGLSAGPISCSLHAAGPCKFSKIYQDQPRSNQQQRQKMQPRSRGSASRSSWICTYLQAAFCALTTVAFASSVENSFHEHILVTSNEFPQRLPLQSRVSCTVNERSPPRASQYIYDDEKPIGRGQPRGFKDETGAPERGTKAGFGLS